MVIVFFLFLLLFFLLFIQQVPILSERAQLGVPFFAILRCGHLRAFDFWNRNHDLREVIVESSFDYSSEQLNSSSYDTSSDIYSAGLILLELLMWKQRGGVMDRMFKTDMHRLTTFHNVRVNPSNLPEEIKRDFPEYQKVLTQMLSLDPAERPSAQELLQMPLFTKKSNRDLMMEIEDRDRQIKEMQRKVGCDVGCL